MEPRRTPVRIGEEDDLPGGVGVLLGALDLVRCRGVIAPFQTPVEPRAAPTKIGGGVAPPGEVAHAGVSLRGLGHHSRQGGTGLEAEGGDPHHEISAKDWSLEGDWNLDDLEIEEMFEEEVMIEETCHQTI